MSKEADLQFCKHAVLSGLVSRDDAKLCLRYSKKLVKSGGERPPVEDVFRRSKLLTAEQIDAVHERMRDEPEEAAAPAESAPGGTCGANGAGDTAAKPRKPPAPAKRSASSTARPAPSRRAPARARLTRRRGEAPHRPGLPRLPAVIAAASAAIVVTIALSFLRDGSTPEADPEGGAATTPAQEDASRETAGATPRERVTVSFDGEGWTRVSEEEALAFAAQLQEALAAGDVDAATALFDWEGLLDRCTREPPSPAREPFLKGARESSQDGNPALKRIAEETRLGGTYTLLRIGERCGWPHLRFRLISAESGVDYHDILVAKGRDDGLKIRDMYVFGTGEYLSETMRRVYIPVALESSRNFLDRLLRSESAFYAHIERIAELVKLAREEPRSALAIYDELPADVQRNKSVLLFAVRAASSADESKYGELNDLFRREYPNDPAIDIYSIDGYFLAKEFDRALDAIDRLESSVGGDPYLGVLRAGAKLEQKDFDAAKKFARRAVERETDLVDGYWALVNISLATETYDETVDLLTFLETEFAVEFEDLTTIPEYSGFVKSKPYAVWKGRNEPTAQEPAVAAPEPDAAAPESEAGAPESEAAAPQKEQE